MFIVIEGIDGSGKSTQAKLLADKLEADGVPVYLTREPGNSLYGDMVREILSTHGDKMDVLEQLHLVQADRITHINNDILPNLQKGKVVISDRYHMSTYVYQVLGSNGVMEQYGLNAILDVLKLGIQVEPNLTILMDLEPSVAKARMDDRRIVVPDHVVDSFDSAEIETMEERRMIYLSMAQTMGAMVVNSDNPVNEVADAIYQTVTNAIDEVRHAHH